jgi:phosphomannomutase
MTDSINAASLFARFVVAGDHRRSEYFSLIKELVARKKREGDVWQAALDQVYVLLLEEILTNRSEPQERITFGTSGWRGKLGKDIFVRSVALVTEAIISVYQTMVDDQELQHALGVASVEEAQSRGCVLGFDNRFGGPQLAAAVAAVLAGKGFRVHYAGESTTGVLSAALLSLGGAFSINLTPSHNPLEYGGYKFNAADAGPASSLVTARITAAAHSLQEQGYQPPPLPSSIDDTMARHTGITTFDSFAVWQQFLQVGKNRHGLDLAASVAALARRDDMLVVVDCVHGASRLHLHRFFAGCDKTRLQVVRDGADVTFGGVAPEPSSANLRVVNDTLRQSSTRFKLGAIIDPDGDRIRFTDGSREISMNQFGAMAYHFLHEYKGKKGLVAKTVATSNLANALAAAFAEELFEPSVGFKNFKPVIDRALVVFEESDGISVRGHTPEKDAYVGLLLALEMVLTTNLNLSVYLKKIEDQYGAYYPERDGVTVAAKGEELLTLLRGLSRYQPGTWLKVGDTERRIAQVITIDGTKMIFEDGSWLMIRPSGTEPKVRFYVESRSAAGTGDLVGAAKNLLVEIGVI